MQTLRSTSLRRLPRQLSRVTKATTTPKLSRPFTTNPANMSLFPRFTQEISPLFRLMDDYDRAARQVMRQVDNQIRTFQPKFDVKETKDTYELHGEFPGLEQKDINIEWTDGNTLTVSGRTETHREEGQRPQGFIEEGEASDRKKLQPSVEDENEGGSKSVAKKGSQEIGKHHEPETKYWVSERSVGEFHRSFSFPSLIDQDNVKASLKNGILSIVVPKAQQAKGRKVNIE